MTLKLPDEFEGINGKEAYERILAEAEKQKYNKEQEEKREQSQNNQEPIDFQNPNITKHDYIQIPGHNKVISKYELQGYNNLNWRQQHFKLQDNGLYMPTPKIFIDHLLNVVDVYNSNEKKKLFDANGDPISKKDT